MNDLIHRIVGIIIEAGQSDTKKFRLGETIRYSPSEILEILKQHESEIFGEEFSTQTNTSNTLNALDCVSRVQALNNIRSLYPEAPRINFMDSLAQWKKKYSQYMECERVIENLPSAQPELLTDKEQRIFLAAMGREEKVCKHVDEEYRDCREPYEDSLVWVCHEIIRKVKATLWET